MLHRYFQYLTHPRSEKLEENGLSIGGSVIVVGGELQGSSRSGGSRKGKEEDGLFHHGCFCFVGNSIGFFVFFVRWW